MRKTVRFSDLSILMLTLVMLAGSGPMTATGVDYWLPLHGPEADRVLVPGNPPLTMGARNIFFNCVEFALSLAMTEEEKEQAQVALMDEYLSYKGQLLDDLKELGKIWQQMQQAAIDQRGMFSAIIRDALFEEIAKSPELGISKALRKVLRDSQSVLVDGNPPLTQRSIAAFFEILEFAVKLRDRRIIAWDAATRAKMQKILLTRYQTLTPDARRWLCNADLHGALLLRNWNSTPSDEKNLMRSFIADAFAPQDESEELPIDMQAVVLPPPTFFSLPTELPWPMR